MSDRLKDRDWVFHKQVNGHYSDTHCAMALLMDIRDELKKLNALFHCPNFTAIPQNLNAIRRNTTKKRKASK